MDTVVVAGTDMTPVPPVTVVNVTLPGQVNPITDSMGQAQSEDVKLSAKSLTWQQKLEPLRQSIATQEEQLRQLQQDCKNLNQDSEFKTVDAQLTRVIKLITTSSEDNSLLVRHKALMNGPEQSDDIKLADQLLAKLKTIFAEAVELRKVLLGQLATAAKRQNVNPLEASVAVQTLKTDPAQQEAIKQEAQTAKNNGQSATWLPLSFWKLLGYTDQNPTTATEATDAQSPPKQRTWTNIISFGRFG